MKELTREQLAALALWREDALHDTDGHHATALLHNGLIVKRREQYPGHAYFDITPRGRVLVDVALRAVNAELGKEQRDG